MASITRVRECLDLLAHPDLSDADLDAIHADLRARLSPAMRTAYPTLGQGQIVPSKPYPPGTTGLRDTGPKGELTDEQRKAALTLIGGPAQMKRFMKFRADGEDFFEAEEAQRAQLAALSAASDGGPLVMR